MRPQSDHPFSVSAMKDFLQPSIDPVQPIEQQPDSQTLLQQEFNPIIDGLELTNLQKQFLKFRWLGQISWMENRANQARIWHQRLRLVSTIGGILLPALFTLSVNKFSQGSNATWVYWLTFSFSQVVAISAATEQLFNYGERWLHYRRSVESLKTQGWQFFQLSGPYAIYKSSGTHQEAFVLFVRQIEEVIQRDVEVYTTQMFQQKLEENKQPQNPIEPKSKVD